MTQPDLQFFTLDEGVLIEDLAERIYPETESGPGARELGVVHYIDKLLESDWAHGRKWYMDGPFYPEEATPQQGWQRDVTPREIYREAIEAIEAYCAERFDAQFLDLAPEEQDAVVEALLADEVETFERIDPHEFFYLFKQNVLEGAFADPVYGGNRDKLGWELLDYPGVFREAEEYAEKIRDPEFHEIEPQGLGDILDMDTYELGENHTLRRTETGTGGAEDIDPGDGGESERDPVDVVVIGMGWAGSIIAKELVDDGLDVLGLERGGDTDPERDFDAISDELRYKLRGGLLQDVSKETFTIRNEPNERALPMRQWGAFPIGTGVGGSGMHWGAQTFRFQPHDFEVRSQTVERYGDGKIPDEMTLQDWGVTYEELEPLYTRFERMTGISGDASENPFEGDRSADFPTPRMEPTPPLERFMTACEDLGYHPYMVPSGTLSEAYTNPDGVTLQGCKYTGYCLSYACEWNARASPLTTTMPVLRDHDRFALRANAYVTEIIYDEQSERVEGVTYVDTQTGEAVVQPADVVVAAAYTLNNVRLLLLSDIGTPYDPETGDGTLGKNYCYHNNITGVAFFEDEGWNLYGGAGSLSAAIDDFNVDNFDHSDLDFINGGNIQIGHWGKQPIGDSGIVPPGTPEWGERFKENSVKYFNSVLPFWTQGASLPYETNYLDLDPEYTDAFDVPLLRITFNWDENDWAMSRFLREKMEDIMEAMGADTHVVNIETGDYDFFGSRSTHNSGGAIMGTDPETSVVNTHLQHWDAPNLFVAGASSFPHHPGHNPTGTVAALSFRAAEGIKAFTRSESILT